MNFTHARPWSSNFLELEVCCTCYTCLTLILQNLKLGHVVYFTHDQLWSSKVRRLGHVVYFTHAQPCSSKFWSLRHVVDFEHAQPWSLKLWSLVNAVYLTHAPLPNPDPPNFGAWGMWPIGAHALSRSIQRDLGLQRLELGVLWQV